MADNPFMIGGAVRGQAFADRRDELGRITLDLLGGGANLIVFSPRRYGKTSLLLKVADALRRKGIICAYVDLYAASSKERLVKIMASSLAAAGSSKFDDIIRTIRDMIPSLKMTIRPEGAYDYQGGIEVEVSRGKEDVDSMLSRLCDLPEKIAKRHKKRMVVIFDEFQEITKLDGAYVEAVMRSKIQHHRNVSYVFMGSQQHIFKRIFNDSSRAFFGSGKMIQLQRIPREEFAKFIREKFETGGLKIKDETISNILDVTDCHPYYTQLLCREIWSLCASQRHRSVSDDLVGTSKDLVIRNQDSAYSEMWDSFPGGQRSLLQAMATSGQKRLFGTDFRMQHGLGAPSTVSRSARYLADRGVLEKGPGGHSITDPFFAEWVRRMA